MEFKDGITNEDLKEPYVWLISFLTIGDIFRLEDALKGTQVNFRKNWTDIEMDYPDICAILGRGKAARTVRMLSGQYVYFPAITRNCMDKRQRLISTEFNGYNYRELARKYGYSQRHIYRILGHGRKKPCKVDQRQLSLFNYMGGNDVDGNDADD